MLKNSKNTIKSFGKHRKNNNQHVMTHPTEKGDQGWKKYFFPLEAKFQ